MGTHQGEGILAMEYSLLKLQITHYIKQVLSLLWVKGLFAFVYAILIPHQYMLQGFALLFVIDFLTGVWVAAKSHNVSSAGMRRGVAKLIIYFLAILTVAVAEKTTTGTEFMVKATIGLLVATEAISVLENLMVLGLPVPLVGVLIRLIQDKAKSHGLNFGKFADQSAAVSVGKDLVDILNANIPAIRCIRLQTCMQIWVSRWYTFVTTLSVDMLGGNPELVWQRILNLENQALRDIRYDLTRAGIPEIDQAVFLEHWNGQLVLGLIAVTKESCKRAGGSTNDKLTSIQTAVALMIYRLLKEVRAIDSAATHDSDLFTANVDRLDMTPSGVHRALRGVSDESSGKHPGTDAVPIAPGVEVTKEPGSDKFTKKRQVCPPQGIACGQQSICSRVDCPMLPKP